MNFRPTRSSTMYVLLSALFLTILTAVTNAHGNGVVDNTFGNNNPKMELLPLLELLTMLLLKNKDG